MKIHLLGVYIFAKKKQVMGVYKKDK